jgi:NADPH:quinone reductase-like Zn-dependent oxidoreductase
MKACQLRAGANGIDGLRLVDLSIPRPGVHEILVRVRAASINYRDRLVVSGAIPGGRLGRDTVPLSDAAGEVVEAGAEVTRFRSGDRVAGTFFQVWKDGPRSSALPSLGYEIDGVLSEYVLFHEDGAVAIPPHLSFEEASTLPCAAVTAWNALKVGKQVAPGDVVLCQGTGSVSTFALQFAKMSGALVIVTSSNDEGIRAALALGASFGINYTAHPEWELEVQRLTSSRGAEHIVEVGGAGTLPHSYRAIAYGGKIGLVGILAAPHGDQNPYPLMAKGGSMHGVTVGSTQSFIEMNRAIELHGMRPIIGTVFSFDDAAHAFRCTEGKVVISF